MKKNYKDLTFTNNFMFCKILENNPDLCKELTETILDVKIREIVKLDQQHFIKSTPDGHGVRFDVYFEDDENTVYDIEMQTSDTRELRKRTRYYQSMIDRKILDQGKHYTNLKKSYIIFICTFDLFEEGLPKYTFRNTCDEDRNIELGDDAIKVFVNATSESDNMSPEMKDFIKYLASGDAEGPLSQKIDSNLERARRNPEWEDSYMTFEEWVEDERAEAIEQTRAHDAKVLAEKLKFSFDEAMSMLTEE